MGFISNIFQSIIWTLINIIFGFIDAIYSAFVKLNSINIINDVIGENSTLTKAYNWIIVIAVVVLGFFAIYNFVKKFLDPDETPPTGTIALEIVKCTVLVVISSTILVQLFNFSTVLSVAMGNLFSTDNTSFSSSIVSSYVEINEDFKDVYDSKAQSSELKKFNEEKQKNINSYISAIKTLKKDLNSVSSTTGIKYNFNENTYKCSTKKVKKSQQDNPNTTFDPTDHILTADDKNNTNLGFSLQDKINSWNKNCNDLQTEAKREFEGKSSKFPNTPDKDPFASAGVDVNSEEAVNNFIKSSFMGDNYNVTSWVKDDVWNWYYVTEDGAFGIDLLDKSVTCWGGNTILLLFVGIFLIYAMFFSGLMLARRQLEMLLMFFFSPIIFACSICNKQRRQSLYEMLASLTLQAAAIMIVLNLGAILIGQISNMNFGSGLEGLLIKTFFICGVATLILTGSQAVNRFIGSNVSANSGREALQSMAGLQSATAGTGLAVAGAGLMAGKIASNPVSSAKIVGNQAGAVKNTSQAKFNSGKAVATGAVATALAGANKILGSEGLGNTVEGLRNKSNTFATRSQDALKRRNANKSNIRSLIQEHNMHNPIPSNFRRYRRF